MNVRRVVAVVGLVAVALLGCAARGPQLVEWSLTPSAPFDPAAVPPAPDYTQDTAWLALPTTDDEADVALPALPAAVDPAADVFYLHPTSMVSAAWNAPADDPQIRAASVRGGTLIQASAFNAAGAVYAPTYRQSTGLAYVHQGPDDMLAIGVALADVRAAFAEFRRRAGDRPFLLAGHSQGAALAAELLRSDIAGTPLQDQLVAAYLIGAPVDAAEVSGCRAPDEVGCVVTFNARGPGHVRGVFEFRTQLPEDQQLCVNPTLGRVTDEAAPRTAHRGAVFFDAEAPALLPSFLASQCRGGRLVVEELQPLPAADWPSRVLRRVMGRENYHPVEVQLFYGDLRADAVRRSDAWRAGHPEGE